MDFQTANNLQTYGGGMVNTTQSISGGILNNDLVGQAGDLLTGGIFTSVLSAFKNLSNIGASTNPTQEMNSFLRHIQPILESKMASINANNVSQVLTEIDQELMFNYFGYKILLDNHSRANITKEAYRTVLAKCNELRSAVHTYVSGLKNQGAKIIQTTKSQSHRQLENVYTFADGRKFGRDYGVNVTSNVYTVVLPVQKPVITKPVVTQPVNTNPVINDNGNIADEPVIQQASSGGIFGIAIIGYFLYMIFNKKK